MTGSSDLNELITRVEGATGPNFALEQLIHDTLFPPSERGGTFPDGTPIPAGWGGNCGPAYTASLDAALALCSRVLPGASILMGMNQTPTTKPWARVGGSSDRGADNTAPTPALALCLAILRAKASDHDDLSSVSFTFNALHLDGTMTDGWHEHTWKVTAWRKADPWTDGRSMLAALESLIDAIAPMQRDESRRLPPELWTNEALGRAILVLGNVVKVTVERKGFGAEVWA